MIALYCRTSTDKQEKGLESQKRALIELCKTKGIAEYEVFEDFGVSGAKASRAGLDALMIKVRAKSIKSVIVYSFSRFARSTRHLLDALNEFESLDVSFISLSENIDTSSAMGKALFTIISAISQLERELISERVRNGLKNARAKGKILGRKKSRNSPLILELSKQGMSYRKISSLVGCALSTIHRELRSVP